MQETQKTICDWAEETFGPAPSLARIAARANEEMAELLRHATSGQAGEKLVEEAADVVIILYRIAENCGLDLLAAVDEKMVVNRAREWRLDKTGHGYHVRAKKAAT